MAISWYLCKCCSILIRNDKTPSNLHCPRNNVHIWTKVCDWGSMNYLCKKCGTLVQGPEIQAPTNINCPNHSNGTSHIWYRLGTVGLINYMCTKCGAIVHCNKTPNSNGCLVATTHYWKKL